ncbi:FAD-dependent oxidoreductase [Mesorhizobium silamurunense]|uniref:FAD-dependent oxidoreductase n=1 Tax=Mesorhizobium silamurunense TaxID=499528 RepID=UPI0017859538
MLVPGDHIIDPWSAPLAYARQAIAHGAVILRATEVTGGQRVPDGWLLKCSTGTVQARIVVNAAGNLGDLIEKITSRRLSGSRREKGQFVVLTSRHRSSSTRSSCRCLSSAQRASCFSVSDADPPISTL